MQNELTLAEIQQESFKVLLKIKEIFEENNWEYYLTYGTLIGAIRHDGFIPWDDDIDIWVPRKYYEKFVDYCIEHKEELLPFELLHYKTNDKYIYPIARFSDSRYEIKYKNTKEYGLGLFVDIYPLDGSNEKDKIQINRIKYLKKKIDICGANKMIESSNKIKNILKIPYYNIVKHYNITKLLKKIDRLSQKYSYDTARKVGCLCWRDVVWDINKDLIYNEEKKYHVFNGEKFMIPCKYDEVLTFLYGDYMKLPPDEEQVAHHFYEAKKKEDKE